MKAIDTNGEQQSVISRTTQKLGGVNLSFRCFNIKTLIKTSKIAWKISGLLIRQTVVLWCILETINYKAIDLFSSRTTSQDKTFQMIFFG